MSEPTDVPEAVDPEPIDTAPTGTEPTGNGAIDAALASLTDLADAPVTEHVTTYDAIHQVLRATLADAGRSA